jgi:hypothetical protein
MIRDWLLIASAIACLWGLWLLLQFVFDSIDQYHAAWREEREREDSATRKGTGSSDW